MCTNTRMARRSLSPYSDEIVECRPGQSWPMRGTESAHASNPKERRGGRKNPSWRERERGGSTRSMSLGRDSSCHELPLKKRVQCSTYREGRRKQNRIARARDKPWGHGEKESQAHELTQPFQSNKQNQIHQSSFPYNILLLQPKPTCM